MLLDIENLRVRYGRNQAIKGIGLQVEEGTIVAVLGANGAGKTMLLRAIQGMVRCEAGSLQFRGADISSLSTPARVKRGLVLVPEGRQIFTSMTVHENLLMGCYTRSDNVDRDIDDIYDRFQNLAQRRNMPASVLSGGEQQMLAISRALLARPTLMMLDEPSLGLSPLLVERLFDLITSLNKQGLSILLVEQNTNMALEVCSSATVLELGSIFLQGTADEVRGSQDLAQAYLGAKHGAEPKQAIAGQ